MKIIIVGVGKLGEYLAKNLVKEGHAVTLIDLDFTTSRDIINNEDLNYINGNGIDANILIEAGIKDTDILISVMDQDELNTICCLLGKKLGAKHTIARIRTPEFANSTEILKEDLGLSMTINPEKLTANHIARVLSIPSALDATIFFKGRIQMISVKVKENSDLSGLSINALQRKIEGRIIVCAIERNNEIIIPRGNHRLQQNDIIHITGARKDINEFLHYTHLSEQTKNVIISGGSNTAIYLAKSLIEMDMNVKIIELNEERCELLSEKLPEALIINGDESDQNLLYEEELDKCDAFVSLCSIDEENIITSMFDSVGEAIRQGAFHVSSILTSTGYSVGDINIYPSSCRILFLLLMVISACAGSTCGGFKISRLLICLKGIKRDILKTFHPNLVQTVTFEGKKVDETTLKNTTSFLFLYIGIIVILMFLISLDGFTLDETVNAVFATFANVSLCFDISSFADFSNFSKFALSIGMLFGRLEIYPIIVWASSIKR